MIKKYGRKASRIGKWFGKIRKKIVKRCEKYGRKASWIVKRYEIYGRNPSSIVKQYGNYGRKLWKDMEIMEEREVE